MSVATRLDLGYTEAKLPCSDDLFRSVRDEGAWREEEKRGQKGFDQEDIKRIEQEWESPTYSRPTADHVGDPGVDTFEGAPQVRVLLCHPSHVARDLERRGICSWSSAMRYRPDHVVPSRKRPPKKRYFAGEKRESRPKTGGKTPARAANPSRGPSPPISPAEHRGFSSPPPLDPTAGWVHLPPCRATDRWTQPPVGRSGRDAKQTSAPSVWPSGGRSTSRRSFASSLPSSTPTTRTAAGRTSRSGRRPSSRPPHWTRGRRRSSPRTSPPAACTSRQETPAPQKGKITRLVSPEPLLPRSQHAATTTSATRWPRFARARGTRS